MDRARLHVQVPRPASVAAPILMMSGVAGGPFLFVALLFIAGLDAPLPLQLCFPWSVLGLEFLPSDGAILGFMAGMLQGPAYGFLLGLHPSPRRHPRLWTAVGACHCAAASVALLA